MSPRTSTLAYFIIFTTWTLLTNAVHPLINLLGGPMLITHLLNKYIMISLPDSGRFISYFIISHHLIIYILGPDTLCVTLFSTLTVTANH